jgi:F0F1-type ATP synthase membrane subunit a
MFYSISSPSLANERVPLNKALISSEKMFLEDNMRRSFRNPQLYCLALTCFIVYIYVWEKKKSSKIPKGNQNPYIEEELTTQSPKEKGQKNKQRSTKHNTEN